MIELHRTQCHVTTGTPPEITDPTLGQLVKARDDLSMILATLRADLAEKRRVAINLRARLGELDDMLIEGSNQVGNNPLPQGRYS
jgi:hypothetical protein